MRLLVALALLSACQHREPITACADDLHGVYVTPSGARWMFIDNRLTLELFPLFDDTVPDGAPRVIDLRRENDKLAGEIKRRFMQRALTCDARAPFHVTACREDALQVVTSDVSPPLAWAPCAWSSTVPSRVETWRRE